MYIYIYGVYIYIYIWRHIYIYIYGDIYILYISICREIERGTARNIWKKQVLLFLGLELSLRLSHGILIESWMENGIHTLQNCPAPKNVCLCLSTKSGPQTSIYEMMWCEMRWDPNTINHPQVTRVSARHEGVQLNSRAAICRIVGLGEDEAMEVKDGKMVKSSENLMDSDGFWWILELSWWSTIFDGFWSFF